MTGTGEVRGANIGVGKIAHRQGAIIRRNACRGPVLEIDGDREGSRMGAVVFGNHGVEVQPLGFLARHGGADDAGGVAYDEGHLFTRAMHRSNDEIAFVLAPVIIHDHNDLACLEGADRFNDAFLIVCHAVSPVISVCRSGRGHAGNGRPQCRRP